MQVLPDLSEISRQRKGLGLTQAQLATLAGVSQSAVAKIERGKMTPSYEIVRKLFDCLQKQAEKTRPEKTASKVRTKGVRSVPPEATLQAAAEVMRHHGFSQLPVIEGGKNLGHVTESTVAKLILEGRDMRDLASIRVAQVMDPPLPTIDDKAPVSLVAALLQRYAAVLVVKGGEITGIIAKSDLMKLL